MKRKIIASAVAALAVGTFTTAPRVADATITSSVSVTDTVPSTTTVATTSNATNTTWTGSATGTATFVITVTSNDAAGYTFDFAGANTGFRLHGSSHGIYVPYTVTDTSSFSYTSGGSNSQTVFSAAAFTGTASTFTVNLPVQASVPADTYSDTITATVNPL